jgi:4a-hydroxytetrahydrobiopterin dehydratase
MSLKALSEAEIVQRLKATESWQKAGAEIQRVFQFSSFMDSIAFVNQMAAHAESVDHHPDILVQYNKVTLKLSTHDAHGITQKDFDFAKVANEHFNK